MKINSNISTDNWPRLLIIEPISEGALNSLSSFAVHKALQGLAGELKCVKRIKSGRLLVEFNKQHHSKCPLKSKIMCNISIKFSAHTSLNSSKGVIRSRDLEGVGEYEMLENLFSQECHPSRRYIFVGIMNCFRPIPSSWHSLNILSQAGYLKIPVVPFMPNLLMCFKCHSYWQGEKRLSWHVLDVVKLTTRAKLNVISCAYSRECPKWKQEKQVQQVKSRKTSVIPWSQKIGGDHVRRCGWKILRYSSQGLYHKRFSSD